MTTGNDPLYPWLPSDTYKNKLNNNDKTTAWESSDPKTRPSVDDGNLFRDATGGLLASVNTHDFWSIALEDKPPVAPEKSPKWVFETEFRIRCLH